MSYECSCDFDPASVSSTRPVKSARREYKCEECGVKIAKGHPYIRIWGIWENHSSTFRHCQNCSELLEWARISVPCFCWYYGDLHDEVREMVAEVAPDVPGFFFEYGRRMVAIKRARAKHV